MLAVVGTFTSSERGGRARGLHSFRVHGDVWSPLGELPTFNPSFLANHPHARDVVYVSHSDAGYVSAVAVNQSTGAMRLLGVQPTGGVNGAHLAVSPDGRWLLVASFTSGHLTVLPIDADGLLGPARAVYDLNELDLRTEGQGASRPHQIVFDEANRSVLVPDRGRDRIWEFAFDATQGVLSAIRWIATASGAGPRHAVIHPDGAVLYSVNELASTLAIHVREGPGCQWEWAETHSTLPRSASAQSIAAAICLNSDERFLHVSNRGHDSVACFVLDKDGKSASAIGWVKNVGITPRFMCVGSDQSRLWVASHGSDEIRSFRIHPRSGQLSVRARMGVPSPACILLFQ